MYNFVKTRYYMKKIIAFCFLVLSSTFVMSQSANKLKPSIKNEKASFIQKGLECTTTFQLDNVTETQIEALKKKAATMATIKLDVTKKKGNNYSCSLITNNPASTAYVQRIFLFLEFENFEIDGTTKPSTELATTLNSLK